MQNNFSRIVESIASQNASDDPNGTHTIQITPDIYSEGLPRDHLIDGISPVTIKYNFEFIIGSNGIQHIGVEPISISPIIFDIVDESGIESVVVKQIELNVDIERLTLYKMSINDFIGPSGLTITIDADGNIDYTDSNFEFQGF